MKEKSTTENTLYLPIKQVYFDQIIEGTKKFEYREIKEGITANRYLLKDNNKNYIPNPNVTEQGKKYFIDDYNNGNFPFMPKPYKYLSLAVGYAKERDTAIVEVTGYSFEPNLIRANLFAFWTIVYHLGEIIEMHRVGENIEKTTVYEDFPKVLNNQKDSKDCPMEPNKGIRDSSLTLRKKTTHKKDEPSIGQRTKVFYKECAIAKWNFQDTDDFWSKVNKGVELALIRQKYNKYDKNAVAVAFADDYNGYPQDFDFDLILGYIPRTENEFIAQMMDLGYNDMFVAKITTVKDKGEHDERLRMTIYIQSKKTLI